MRMFGVCWARWCSLSGQVSKTWSEFHCLRGFSLGGMSRRDVQKWSLRYFSELQPNIVLVIATENAYRYMKLIHYYTQCFWIPTGTGPPVKYKPARPRKFETRNFTKTRACMPWNGPTRGHRSLMLRYRVCYLSQFNLLTDFSFSQLQSCLT